LWDLTTGKEKAALQADAGFVYAVAFGDGKLLASGHYDGGIRLWDSGTAKTQAVLKGHTRSVTCLAFSPNGKLLASGSRDETARIWDIATGKAVACLKHAGRVRISIHLSSATVCGVAFSGDGKAVASAAGENTVLLWDVARAEQKGTLQGQSDHAQAVSRSRSGNLLALGNYNGPGTVTLWDVAAGRPKVTFRGHVVRVTSLALSPDAKTLALSGDDGSVRLWDVAAILKAAK
jgi:WD40 repeat protein